MLCCRLHLYRNRYFWSPSPLHLKAQLPLHEPLVDANGNKTQSQRPLTCAPPTKGTSTSSQPPLRWQLQLASATKEPVPGASEAEPAMVRAAGERAAAVDKGRGPVGPLLADLAIGSPVPFPPVQAPRASDVRAGYLGLYIAPVNQQPLWYVAPFFQAGQGPPLSALLWASVEQHVHEQGQIWPLWYVTTANSHFLSRIGLLCGACVVPVFRCAVTER